MSIARRSWTESPREAALRMLKIRGEMSLVELERSLKLTETAVRRHLETLIRKGLVVRHSRQQGQGRPLNIYRLTERATTDYFPNGYEDLAAVLLDTIFDTSGHKGVFEFLSSSNQHLVGKLKPFIADTTLEQRVVFLARYYTERGYMTDFRRLPNGNFFLYHQNCAVHSLATKYRQLCLMELRLIEAITQAKVIRKQYMFKQHRICGYRITPSLHGEP